MIAWQIEIVGSVARLVWSRAIVALLRVLSARATVSIMPDGTRFTVKRLVDINETICVGIARSILNAMPLPLVRQSNGEESAS